MGVWNADKLRLKDSNGDYAEYDEADLADAISSIDGVTAGTVTASKIVKVDANKDVAAFRNVTVTNLDAGASGTAGSVDVFPATAAKGKTTFTAANNAGNTTTTITTAAQAAARTYTVPDAGASAASFLFTTGAATATSATTTEIDKLAGVVAGTSTASKAAVLGADKNLDVLALPVSGLKIGSGAGTAVTTTAAQLNQVTDAFGTVAFDRATKIARVALAAVDTGGGVFSWANPEAGAILVTRVVLDVTTQSSGACTLDVGMTATDGTTSADNLIDGLSLATAGVYDNIEDQGTNGTSRQKVATGKWVTGSVASGASSGVVGYAYIHYNNI